jgi:hypothetical protein
MSPVSRRDLFAFAAKATAVSALTPAFSIAAHAASAPNTGPLLGSAANPRAYQHSLDQAFVFLNRMMDAYAAGSTVRLTQSYSDQALGATAFTYDNAVAIQAYLARGSVDDLRRAQVLGDGLLYAQQHNFPFADGRFAQAYYVNTATLDGAYITPAAAPFYFYTSAVGDQAWAGMALAALYQRTRQTRYLSGALSVANWIVANTYSTLGPGGYSFGTNINQFNQSVPSPNGKSTEHNIDTYAFFTMLATLTHGGTAANGTSWAALAQHALAFVHALYDQPGGFFYTGTLGDQITTNTAPIPEDCQTWSYLALLDRHYQQTIDWAIANLQTTDTAASPNSSLTGNQRFTGMVFDTASLSTTAYDPNAVWLEGTGHTIAALVARVLHGGDSVPALFRDLQTALRFVDQSQLAQQQLGSGQTVNGTAIPLGEGLVASTSVLDTGFGYTYGPSLHIGATGWYLLGALAGNPFQLQR